MIPDDVDAQIVASMDGSRLQQVIADTPYQPGSAAALPQGVNLLGLAPDPSAPPGVQQQHQQYVTNLPQTQQPLTAAPGGMAMGPSQEDIQRYQQIALQAAQGRIEADERAFQAEIASLPDDEKERRVLERELEQTQQVNQWLNGRMEFAQAQQQAQQQATAKNMWGFIAATQAGLPYNNPAIKAALMGANSPQEMQQIAQGLVALVTGQQQQAAMQQAQSGLFAAGGSQGVPAPQQQGLQQFEGSGDLSGLINSRGYVTAQW